MDQVGDFCNFAAGALRTERGDPFLVEPFQRRMLDSILGPDPCSEVCLILSKKSGKSSLLAAIALWHVLVTDFAECVIVASSRDQASVLLRQVHGFIRRSPELTQRLEVKQREIVNPPTGGRVRVMAADAGTVDGVIPTLALFDELHRAKTGDLYQVLRDSLGAREAQLVSISTAGDSEESPLGVIRAKAYTLPGMVREGPAYRYVRAGGFCLHEWALDEDADTDDLDLVLEANPASWTTRAELERRRNSPSMRSWEWRRFTCGQWARGEDSAIAPTEWADCESPDAVIPDGATGVYLGADFAWRHDTTALVPVWRPEDDPEAPVVVGDATIIAPPGDGTSTKVETIQDAIEAYCDRWPELALVFDRHASGEPIAQWAESRRGLVTIETPQLPRLMAAASERLATTVAEGGLIHPGDPALTAQILNAAAKPVGESWRLVKGRDRAAKIDAAIALAMALNVAANPPKPARATLAFLD